MSDARSNGFDDRASPSPVPAGSDDDGERPGAPLPTEVESRRTPDLPGGRPDHELSGQQPAPPGPPPPPSGGARHGERAGRHDPEGLSEVTSLIDRDQFFPGAAALHRRDGPGAPPPSGPPPRYAPPSGPWPPAEGPSPEPAPHWDGTPEPSTQWQPAAGRSAEGRGPQPPPRSPDQQPAGNWGAGAPTWNQAQGSAADFSYVSNIRSSELVPARKIPPRRGWRKAVYAGTFGLINLGWSPDERHQAELETKIRSLLRGTYKIGVLGKGGVGKTTMAACVGSIFAELRPDDRVVAIDADTAFGKLATRIDPRTSGSYWELAGDQHLHTFADVRSRVGSNASGLFVLGGEVSTARRRVLDPAIYRAATAQLDKHFTLSIVDCSSTMDAAVTRAAIDDLDALIVVSSSWYDGASTAGQTLEWLAHNGYTGLLHRTVVVVNNSDGQASKRDVALLVERFGSRGQKVIEMPYDRNLRPAGVIDVTNEINKLTRRRLLELAAALAEHFAATSDRPNQRR